MEEKTEANVETVDQKMDTFLDGKEKPEDTSTSKPEETETEETEAEDTTSKKSDAKETEEKAPEVPKEFHKHPAWQRIMKERDAHAAKLKEFEETSKTGLSQTEIDEFRKVTSSPEFIRTRMESQGYKQEAIDSELRRMGHTVQERPGDDVALVTSKLGLDPKSIDENLRATIGDYAKIARVIFQDAMGKVLPEQLKPLQEAQAQQAQKQSALDIAKQMEKTITAEGILDFEEDIQPAMNEFLDKNPNATQEDAANYFREVNHTLSIERLKSGKRKEKRDVVKKDLRSQKSGVQLDPSKAPARTGNDDKDIDSFLDHAGMNR